MNLFLGMLFFSFPCSTSDACAPFFCLCFSLRPDKCLHIEPADGRLIFKDPLNLGLSPLQQLFRLGGSKPKTTNENFPQQTTPRGGFQLLSAVGCFEKSHQCGFCLNGKA